MAALSGKEIEQLRLNISCEIESLAAGVAQKVFDGEHPTYEIGRIEALQKALSGLPIQPTNFLRCALTTGAVCLIAASAAGTIPVRKTRIQLDVASTTVTVRLAEDYLWNGIWRVNPELIQLNDFTSLSIPPEYRKNGASPVTNLSLGITNGRAWVSELNLSRGLLLTISQNDLVTNLLARAARFRGHLDVIGSVVSLENQLKDLNFDSNQPPGLFQFDYTGAPASAKRALLRITPAEKIIMREIPVSGLGFSEEHADDLESSHFASQIVFGVITLTDTGKSIPLTSGTALELENAQGIVMALEIATNATRVNFEGSVRGITLGSGEFAQNLKPTILEWLFHQQTLALLWGALVFLFGTAVSARKFLSGQT
jgi:hypothetical protein